MKFTASSKEMNEVLTNMNRVINSKNSLPILADIVFEIKNNNLGMKASDGEILLMAQVTVTDNEGEGCFAVNTKSITDAIKNIPDSPLTFSIGENDTVVKVDYFSGMFTLPVDNADEFPSMPEINEVEKYTFSIIEGLLQENIARTVFATADEELRPVMNGVCFDLTTENLTVVASDGHQLVRNNILSVKAEDNTKVSSFILPKKAAYILKNILKKSMVNNVEVTFNDRQLYVKASNVSMQCRLIEGRYPNYNSVIPQNNPNIVTVDRTALVAALKRVSPFANDTSQLVRIHVESGKLQLNTEDYDFSKTASEEIACDYSGTPMNIGLKGTKTMEILSNINSQEIEIQLADPTRAALIVPSEQPEGMDILMLQMPMLLND